jgi:nitroimidazol reductase NimA-like FMN-containing flavoprotein (pyridoxamine 5'-phosphate oxidase superfamily)
MAPDDCEPRPMRETELEELTREECLALLGSATVGRIALVGRDDLPLVLPVNHVMVGDTVVFRTDAGAKLDALLRHPVAFQIDEIDHDDRTGWSVLVQGIAHPVAPNELPRVHLEPWLGPRDHWVQLVPRHLTGRRIRLAR